MECLFDDELTDPRPDEFERLNQVEAEAQVILDSNADDFEKAAAKTKREGARVRKGVLKLPDANMRNRPPNVNDYGHLLEHAVKLFDNNQEEGSVYLHNTLLKFGCDADTLKGFTWDAYQGTAEHLIEMLDQDAKQKRRRHRTPSVTTKGTHIEPDAQDEQAPSMVYQQLVKKYEALGMSRTDVYVFLGAERGTGDMTLDVLQRLDKKLQELTNSKMDNLFEDEESNESAPQQTSSNDLFDDTATTATGSIVDTETGEVPGLTLEAEKEEARKALGLDKADKLEINTLDDLKKRLRQRAVILGEFGMLKQEWERESKRLLNELKSWEFLFKNRCEAFLEANKPADKASIPTLYGRIGFRNMGESISLKDDIDEIAKQGYLHREFTAGRKDAIEPVTAYKCDLDKLKEKYKQQIEAYRIARAKHAADTSKDKGAPPTMPEHPILQYKPPRQVLTISPSLDTIEKEAKEQKWTDKYQAITQCLSQQQES